MTNETAVVSCFNCAKLVTEDDFCYGCKSYVCEECDINDNRPPGEHDAYSHTEEPEEEDGA